MADDIAGLLSEYVPAAIMVRSAAHLQAHSSQNAYRSPR